MLQQKVKFNRELDSRQRTKEDIPIGWLEFNVPLSNFISSPSD